MKGGFRACGRLYLELASSWWRHQMEIFSVLLVIYAGNSPVTGEFPAQRPVKRSFDVFFYLLMNKWWVNNGEVGDLRRQWAHYDVSVTSRNVLKKNVCVIPFSGKSTTRQQPQKKRWIVDVHGNSIWPIVL